MEQANFAYSPSGKAFEKQTNAIEEQWRKQVKASEVLKWDEIKEDTRSIKGLFPKDMRTNEIKNEIIDFRKWENKSKQKDLKFETNIYIYIYIYLIFNNLRSFADSIYNSKIVKWDISNKRNKR